MSRLPSPTSAIAVNTRSIPGDALTTASLGRTADALPDAPIGTQKEEAALVMVTVYAAGKGGLAEQYFAQVYGGSADNVYYVTSPETLVDIVADYARIDHLVILGHGFSQHIALGTGSKTPKQLQAMLAPVMPKMTRMTIDGCMTGQDPVGLFDMAVGLGLAEVHAWTYFHHLEIWGRPEAKPDPAENLDAVIDFAAPYVPQGSTGGHVSASQLKASGGRFSVVTEFFTANLGDGTTFETLTDRVTHPGPTGPPLPDPWTTVRTPAEAEFPRSAVEALVVTSAAQAKDAAVKVTADRAMPYEVVLRP